MKFIGPLLIKYSVTTAILWIVLGLYFNVTFIDILATSSILTALAYLGDIFILPIIGRTAALIVDFALTWVVVWSIGNAIFQGPISLGTAAFISAIATTVGEFFFHRYLNNQVFRNNRRNENKIIYFPRRNFQTEFSSEINENKNDNTPPEKDK